MLLLPRNNAAHIVEQALSFQKPDRLPVFEEFLSGFEKKWRRQRDIAPETAIEDVFWSDLSVPVAQEVFFPSQLGVVRTDGADIYRNDGWGRIVRTRQNSYFSETVERIFTNPSDLDTLQFESAQLDSRYQDFVPDVQRLRHSGRAVFVKIGGVYIRSCFLRGEVEFLMDLAADEAFARALAERVADHLLHVGLESMRRAQAQDFGVWIYDDMCNINAPMYSPATFERIFLPIYAKMITVLKDAGARWVILHSDGNLSPFLDLVIEAGFDGINPVEHSAGMDIVQLIEKYHGRLCFIGGICNTHILPSGAHQCIRQHVEAVIEAAQNGGIIIGTHSIGPDIPVEAYELYRTIVADEGNYSRKETSMSVANPAPAVNIPWQDPPAGTHPVVWRYDQNPVIPRDIIPCANSIFNSALVPFDGGYAGVFRVDSTARNMRLHVGRSRNGIDFEIDPEPLQFSCSEPEIAEFVEGYDPRVCFVEDRYYVTWCNSYHGPTIGVAYTYDFQTFHQIENAFLPFNRNGVLFPRRIGGKYLMLSRPSDTGHTPFGDIFISQSPDMIHWGAHRHVMSPRRGRLTWECTKIGAGPIPIEIDEGWLFIYHGVLTSCNGFVYCMGAAILDRDQPWKVLYRAVPYLLSPQKLYECVGDVPNVVFPCAALHEEATGRIAIYYGAADTCVGLAFTRLNELVSFIKENSQS